MIYLLIISFFSCLKQQKIEQSDIKAIENSFVFNSRINISNPQFQKALKKHTHSIDSMLNYQYGEFRIWRFFIAEMNKDFNKIVIDCGYPDSEPIAFFKEGSHIFFVYIFPFREKKDSTFVNKFIFNMKKFGINIKKHRTGEFVFSKEFLIFRDSLIERKADKNISCPSISDTLEKYIYKFQKNKILQ